MMNVADPKGLPALITNNSWQAFIEIGFLCRGIKSIVTRREREIETVCQLVHTDACLPLGLRGDFMEKLWLILPILFLYGCAGIPCKQGAIIEVGKPELVKDCQLLEIIAKPGGDFIYGTPYMGNYKDEAIERAEKIGATHIVYRSELSGNGIGYTNVIYAYKCPQDHDTFLNEEKNKEEEY